MKKILFLLQILLYGLCLYGQNYSIKVSDYYRYRPHAYQDNYIFYFGNDVTSRFSQEILSSIKENSRRQFSKSRIPWKKRQMLKLGVATSVESLYKNRKKRNVSKNISKYGSGFFIIDPCSFDASDSIQIFKDTNYKLLVFIDDSLGSMQVVAHNRRDQSTRFLSGSIHKPYYNEFKDFKKDLNITFSQYFFKWNVAKDFEPRGKEIKVEIDTQYKTREALSNFFAYDLWIQIHIMSFTGPESIRYSIYNTQYEKFSKVRKFEYWYYRDNRLYSYSQYSDGEYFPISYSHFKGPYGFKHSGMVDNKIIVVIDRKLFSENLELCIRNNRLINANTHPYILESVINSKEVPGFFFDSVSWQDGCRSYYQFLLDSLHIQGSFNRVVKTRDNNKEKNFPLCDIYFAESPTRLSQVHVRHICLYECPAVVIPTKNYNKTYVYSASFNLNEEKLYIRATKNRVGIGQTVELINIIE